MANLIGEDNEIFQDLDDNQSLKVAERIKEKHSFVALDPDKENEVAE